MDQGRSLTADQIKAILPNVPTPPRRIIVAESDLSWDEQAEQVRKICSKALVKLKGMLDEASEPEAVRAIVAALAQAQAMSLKAAPEAAIGPSDEALARAAKKA